MKDMPQDKVLDFLARNRSKRKDARHVKPAPPHKHFSKSSPVSGQVTGLQKERVGRVKEASNRPIVPIGRAIPSDSTRRSAQGGTRKYR